MLWNLQIKTEKNKNSIPLLFILSFQRSINNSKNYLQYAYLDESGNIVDSAIKEKVDEWFYQNNWRILQISLCYNLRCNAAQVQSALIQNQNHVPKEVL